MLNCAGCSVGGPNRYPDLFAKAAALIDSLIRNHPFVDGNKRVGITATAIFLRRNGWRLHATNTDLEQFTLQVAQSRLDTMQIAAWLQVHSGAEVSP